MRTPGIALLAAGLLFGAAAPGTLQAHCQIPCGIYDDEVRFTLMHEHVTTIEKSMKRIVSLGSDEKPNWNQLVRWINNKEDHADELSEIVTQYFLAQRIKPPKDDASDSDKKKYAKHLSQLHQIMVHAMKAKQTTDLDHVKALHDLVDAFRKSYLK